MPPAERGMSGMFKLYPKLAVHNLKSSYRLTVPYLLSDRKSVV